VNSIVIRRGKVSAYAPWETVISGRYVLAGG